MAKYCTLRDAAADQRSEIQPNGNEMRMYVLKERIDTKQWQALQCAEVFM